MEGKKERNDLEGAKRINLLPSPEVCKEQAYFLGMSETLKKLGTFHLLEQFPTVWRVSHMHQNHLAIFLKMQIPIHIRYTK